jgi:Arc/MetJ-type ribon-helix-helix transcriptional regulator
MKTIHIPEELDHFLREMVRSGRYASEESVISDALDRLRQTIDPVDAATAPSEERTEPGKPLTKQRFQRHLVEIGILEEPVDRAGDNPQASVTEEEEEEEVLSEMLIRERLIEWLAGFLGK